MEIEPDNPHPTIVRFYSLARIEPFQTMRDEMLEEARLARAASDYGQAAHASQIAERLSWLVSALQAITLKYDVPKRK